MENQGGDTTMESKKKLYRMFYAYQQSMCVIYSRDEVKLRCTRIGHWR